jgi:ABC-type enterochelin transport system ATPase subunit
MRAFNVATRSDLLKMAHMLEKQEHTIIFRDGQSFHAFKNGKLARVVEVVESKDEQPSGAES